jgi:NAD(P)-dependent dehydrogenase (short-subunit alcohol dehydrogenase family)
VFGELSPTDTEREGAGAYGIHPVLLDGALHAVGLDLDPGQGPRLPFAFSGVSLRRAGASNLRLRLVASGEAGASLALADESGAAVLSLASVAAREVSAAQLAAARDPHRDSLFSLRWRPAPEPPAQGPTPPQLLDCTEDAEPAQALRITAEALARIQDHLADEESVPRLVVLTREAVAAREGDEVTGLAASPLVGLVASAYTENPGRVALVDTDGTEASAEALAEALRSEEPRLAIRQGEVLAPRLARAGAPASPDTEPAPAVDPDRTVLVTGATGTLGSLLARHLVSAHGARRLLLVSRSGEGAEGARELRADLEGQGATVEIAARDVSDRAQLHALLEGIDPDHPLGAVVHAAGVLDDGTIASLDPGRLERVLAPKAQAALHLHQLTEEMDLSAFVLFSSAAATIGSPGQGNYAAANSFLDSLAAYRRSRGLPATSIAWGLWAEESTITKDLGEADRRRMARAGVKPISSDQGLGLLDAVLAGGGSFALAAPLDLPTLRAAARTGMLPPILGELVRAPARRPSAQDGALVRRLAGTPEAEREALVLELTLAEIAAVLGHPSGEEIDPDGAFQDLGFDSLSAVELRNRVNALSGLRLPATLVFDYPTPAGMARYLLGQIEPNGAGGAPVEPELKRLEEGLASAGMDDERRRQVSARLQALLVELAVEDGPAGDADVEQATADTIFELLDRELGEG